MHSGPRIETIQEKQLVGMYMSMTLANDQTPALWRGFMHRRQEIKNAVNNELISMQVYAAASFDPHAVFEKWAAVEVSDLSSIPDGMESFMLPAGLYAVFLHKGGPAKGAETFRYIFGTWLPASGYEVDHRPHFEVLGEKYKGNDLESEEEIWIPVRPAGS